MMLYKLLPSWPLQQSSSDESSSTWPLDSSPRFRAACWPPAEATTEATDQLTPVSSSQGLTLSHEHRIRTLSAGAEDASLGKETLHYLDELLLVLFRRIFCSLDACPLLNLSFLDGFAVQFIVEFCLCVEDRRNRGKPVYFPNLLGVQLNLTPDPMFVPPLSGKLSESGYAVRFCFVPCWGSNDGCCTLLYHLKSG